jgi:AraC family transcriptional regulator of arabinose operon
MYTSTTQEFYLEVLLNTKFSINTFAYVECGIDWNVEDRLIPDYDIWYIKKGRGELFVNGERFSIKPGCMYFFRPGDRISATQNLGQNLSVYYCHFQTDVHWFFPQLQVKQGCYVKDLRVEFHLFQGLELQENGHLTPEDQRLMLVMVFHLLFKAKAMSFYSQSISAQDLPRFEKALIFMNDHISETIELSDLEELLGLEKSGVNKVFKSITGMSTMHFFTQLRVNKAKLLLRKSYSISQVAQDLGYSDLFTFSKVFKRHTGMTPSFYTKHPPESFE